MILFPQSFNGYKNKNNKIVHRLCNPIKDVNIFLTLVLDQFSLYNKFWIYAFDD